MGFSLIHLLITLLSVVSPPPPLHHHHRHHQGDYFILMTVCQRQPPDSIAINQQITHQALSSSTYPPDTFLPFKMTHLPIKEQHK